MADLLLDPLPTAWEGRAIDGDFRPRVWLSNQYLRKKPEQDPAGFLVEAFRRFYREPVPAAQVEDAFAAMLRFYAGGTPDRETRSSGGSGSGEVTFDYAYDADYIVAAFQQAYSTGGGSAPSSSACPKRPPCGRSSTSAPPIPPAWRGGCGRNTNNAKRYLPSRTP